MVDLKHPDRIWAYDDGAHVMAFDFDNTNGGAVKYVRADSIAAPEAQLAERVKGRVFVVTALAENPKKSTMGWRSRLVGASTMDEAVGKALRLFEENEPGWKFSAPGSLEIAADTLATAGILSALEATPPAPKVTDDRAELLIDLLKRAQVIIPQSYENWHHYTGAALSGDAS